MREIRRERLHRYSRSGKMVALVRMAGAARILVVELAPDLTAVNAVRPARYLRRDAMEATDYQAELSVEKLPSDEAGQNLYSCSLVRILTSEDLDPRRWMETESLDRLPVSPEPEVTAEERIWAGERSGNLNEGFALVVAVAVFAWLAVAAFMAGQMPYISLPLLVLSAVFLARFRWRRPVSADPARLKMLDAHKEALRRRRIAEHEEAKTAFDRALEDFSNWRALTPRDFETAIAVRLEKQGFSVSTTRFSKDGGIDIEAVDGSGRPVIVQAKRYSKPVGVAVVREMIGVWRTRADDPRVMICSLMGFTRGARELAASAGIELWSVREHLLRV